MLQILTNWKYLKKKKDEKITNCGRPLECHRSTTNVIKDCFQRWRELLVVNDEGEESNIYKVLWTFCYWETKLINTLDLTFSCDISHNWIPCEIINLKCIASYHSNFPWLFSWLKLKYILNLLLLTYYSCPTAFHAATGVGNHLNDFSWL